MSTAARLQRHIASLSKVSENAPRVSGRWLNVRLQPDMLSGEQINIGVAFVDQHGTVHSRFTSDLSGLRCLYGDRVDLIEMQYLVDLAAEQYDRRAFDEVTRSKLSPHILLSSPTYAAGDSVRSLLDEFFYETVALGQHQQIDKPKRQSRFSSSSNEALRADVFGWLKEHRAPIAHRIIPADSRFKIRTDEHGLTQEHLVELPIRAPGRLVGSIVSAYVSSPDKAELRILQAGMTLNTALRHLQDEACGLFILRPDEESGLPKDVLNRFDDLIDENVWKLRDSGVYVGVESCVPNLGSEIAAWAA